MASDFSPYQLVDFEPRFQDGVIQVVAGCYADYDQVIELDTLDADLTRIANTFAGEGSAFWVLLQDAGVVGSVGVKRTDDGHCELKRVFLQRDHRGQKLGKKMVQHAFAWATDQGYTQMHIWSDCLYETAHHLYRKLGAADPQKKRLLGGRNEVYEYYFIKTLG